MKRFWILLMGLPGVAAAALPFATADVAYRPVDAGYAAEAVVEAGRESTLAAQVAGRILELRVDAGDTVKAGELLARLDDSEARNSIAGTQAQVAQAQANLINAQSQYERTKQLVVRKFRSSASLDKAQADYQAAQAQVTAAKAGVSSLLMIAESSYTGITNDWDTGGTITDGTGTIASKTFADVQGAGFPVLSTAVSTV